MDWFSVIKLDWDPNVPFHELTSRRCCDDAKKDFKRITPKATNAKTGAKCSSSIVSVDRMECDKFKKMIESYAKHDTRELQMWTTLLDRWRDCDNRGYGQ